MDNNYQLAFSLSHVRTQHGGPRRLLLLAADPRQYTADHGTAEGTGGGAIYDPQVHYFSFAFFHLVSLTCWFYTRIPQATKKNRNQAETVF